MEKVSYALGLSIGNNLLGSGIKDLNTDEFVKAIKAVMAGEKPEMSYEEAKQVLDTFFHDLANKINYKNYSNIIGYRELNEYFKNNMTLEEAKEQIKQNTRHYAKRQFTWFKNQMDDIKWFNVNYEDFNQTIKEIKKYLNEN